MADILMIAVIALMTLGMVGLSVWSGKIAAEGSEKR